LFLASAYTLIPQSADVPHQIMRQDNEIESANDPTWGAGALGLVGWAPAFAAPRQRTGRRRRLSYSIS